MEAFNNPELSSRRAERAGVDVGLALLLARSGEARPESQAAFPSNPAGPAPVEPFMRAPSFKARVKRKLRSAAALAFRLARPFVRPVVFRLRAYMTAPLVAEIQRQHQESRQLFPQAQAADPVVGVSQTLLDSQLAEFSLQLIQELQYTRDALRARIDALAHEVGLLRDFAPALERIEQYSYASARRFALPCGNDEMLVRTAAGFLVCPASNAALVATLMEGGELRPGTHRLIQRLLGPDSTFVDVGANIGLHTLVAGFAMQKKGRIVAFEPVPETCRLLRKTLQINGLTQQVDVREAAALDRSVAGPLQALNRDTDALPDRVKGAGYTHPGHTRFERVDDVLGVGAHVDLMCFDVKGAEPDVLAGARDTIAGNTDIGLIVTCKASFIDRTDLPVQDWLKAFQALGLAVGVVNEDTGAVEPQSSLEFSTPDPVSLFFARPESPTWSRALAP